MNVYHFTNRPPGAAFEPTNDTSEIFGTRVEAKNRIKTVLPNQRSEHYVELLEISGKEQIVRAIEGHRDFPVVKRWKFTSRGAMKECDDQGHYLNSIGHIAEEEKETHE